MRMYCPNYRCPCDSLEVIRLGYHFWKIGGMWVSASVPICTGCGMDLEESPPVLVEDEKFAQFLLTL